jgi:glycosyltransferase involved in cell wall biosynthesis
MPGGKRVIVSVTNDLYTDNRVDKVCRFLMDQGYEVLLVGRKRKDSKELPERPYETHRMKLLFEKGPLFYASFNVRLFLFLLIRKADILVANDLDTLLANFLASKFKRRSELVYDSHEFFTEVPELVSRPKVRGIWLRIEKRIFPKLKKVYTVNGSIAASYKERYGKDLEVVRNISPLWNPERKLSKKELGLPEDRFLIILQGAGINVDRGAEEAVEAMKDLENSVLLIVGDGDIVPQLKKNVKEYDLQDKVLFYGKRPYSELMQFTANADIGLTLDKPSNLNYRFSLPNKVFDYIHANTPVICTDLPEVRKVVEGHKVGIVLEEFTPKTLAAAIEELKSDPKRLEKLRQNCQRAAQQESWEGECETLRKIYPKVEA